MALIKARFINLLSFILQLFKNIPPVFDSCISIDIKAFVPDLKYILDVNVFPVIIASSKVILAEPCAKFKNSL